MIDSKKMLEDFFKFAPSNIVEPMVYALNLQGLDYDSKKGKIVSTEPIVYHKLTEFEKVLAECVGKSRLSVIPAETIAEEWSEELLSIARKQIASEIDKNAMVNEFIVDTDGEEWKPCSAYELGIIDCLKVIKGK